MKWDEYINRIVSDTLTGKSFYDPSDIAKNQKDHVISFYHIPSKRSVTFKAWVTDFKDSFESKWNSEEVYGRMDPIQTFSGTKRKITLAWSVVAASTEEAVNNMQNCSTLFRMLYPTNEGTSMAAPPMLRLKFVNLVRDITNNLGLVGTVDGFTYTPDFDHGVFDVGAGEIYPKTIALNCTFTALHTHQMGLSVNDKGQVAGDGNGRTWEAFPYGLKGPDRPGVDSIKNSITSVKKATRDSSLRATLKVDYSNRKAEIKALNQSRLVRSMNNNIGFGEGSSETVENFVHPTDEDINP